MSETVLKSLIHYCKTLPEGELPFEKAIRKLPKHEQKRGREFQRYLMEMARREKENAYSKLQPLTKTVNPEPKP